MARKKGLQMRPITLTLWECALKCSALFARNSFVLPRAQKYTMLSQSFRCAVPGNPWEERFALHGWRACRVRKHLGSALLPRVLAVTRSLGAEHRGELARREHSCARHSV